MHMSMGQSIRKMKNAIEPYNYIRKNKKSNDSFYEFKDTSDSSSWLTEVPTRSSLTFSNPTGESSLLTTESSYYSSNGHNSCNTADNLTQTTATGQNNTNITSTTTTTKETHSEDTSRDHPRLGHFQDFDSQSLYYGKDDHEWQVAVNSFLLKDPIHRHPKKPKRAKYVIKRHHHYIDPNIGKKWRQSMIHYMNRIPAKTIAILRNRESEA